MNGRARRVAFSSLALAVAGGVALSALGSCASVAGGVVDGRLVPCPTSPNCVCSEDADAQHAVDPLPVPAGEGTPVERLLSRLATLPRVEVLETTDSYVHATFTTLVLRFTDDVEFLLDPSGTHFDVRSASRVGHSDLGTNRERVEDLRALLSGATSDG